MPRKMAKSTCGDEFECFVSQALNEICDSQVDLHNWIEKLEENINDSTEFQGKYIDAKEAKMKHIDGLATR